MSRTISNDYESGYSSASNSEDALPEIYFTIPHLKHINDQLQCLEPEGEDIVKEELFSGFVTKS